jgi:hypothetical protein
MDKSQIKSYDWQKLFLELVVVFLGVTAGFLLNNWQNQRQTSSLEKKYLNGFLQDANANISEIRKAVKSDSLWLHDAKPKLLELSKGKLEPDSANALFKMIVNISKADIQTGTYDAIVNSGNLNIISDYKLKRQIVGYSSSISGTRYIEDYFYQYFNEFVMPFVFSNYNVLQGTFDNKGIIKTTKFSNVVAGYYSMVQQRLASYKKLLEDSLKLKDNLKKLE